MDLQLKHWRSQQQNESEEQSYATKMFNSFSHQVQSQTATSATALPLFVPEPTTSSSFSCFSPDSSSSRLLSKRARNFFHLKVETIADLFVWMGNLFSLAQWQELELQALIYRYMLAGASVPQELLLPIKKSLFHQSHLNFLHYPLQHNFPHHQPWYWGRGAVDPEPGRCKRTDGKKWRCSRDVVASYKYCDRHIHRGRNRSRKPVETTTNAASSFALGEKLGQGPDNLFFSSSSSHSSTQHLYLNSHQRTSVKADQTCIAEKSSQILQPLPLKTHMRKSFQILTNCSSEMKQESNNKKRPYEAHNNGRTNDGHILRHFFEDWPQSSDSTSRPMSSSTCHLSISMPSYASSDVSLKLSTCNEEEEANMINNNNNEKEHQQNMNCWSSGGNDYNMDGPLAEALRSASPTSSLLQQMGISTQIFR
ncbi:hypothetical protein YC2023_044806 [Brassica napus]